MEKRYKRVRVRERQIGIEGSHRPDAVVVATRCVIMSYPDVTSIAAARYVISAPYTRAQPTVLSGSYQQLARGVNICLEEGCKPLPRRGSPTSASSPGQIRLRPPVSSSFGTIPAISITEGPLSCINYLLTRMYLNYIHYVLCVICNM
jgi:hypothetical protein